MLPGFQSPSAGFDSPFEMLHACHERVERTLDLLERLQRHVHTHGADAQARQAAHDVVRYFDIAAPLHHQDEELHVFPPLLASNHKRLAQTAKDLIEQHREMEQIWRRIKVSLLSLQLFEAGSPANAIDIDTDDVAAFCALYRSHIQLEESTAYPSASDFFSEQQLKKMSRDMQIRRKVPEV